MINLSRNMFKKNLLSTLEAIKEQTDKPVDSNTLSLIKKILNISIAIFSSIISGILVSLLSTVYDQVWVLFSVFTILVVIFIIASNRYLKEIIQTLSEDSKPKTEVQKILEFNNVIIPSIVEVEELLDIINTNVDSQESKIAIIVAFYLLNDIINFLIDDVFDGSEDSFSLDISLVRTKKNDHSSKILNAYINSYAIVAVIDSLVEFDTKISVLIDKDDFKKFIGFGLFEKDFNWIHKNINLLKDIRDKHLRED